MYAVYYTVLIPMVYLAFTIFILGMLWQGIRILSGFKYSLTHAVGPEKKPKLSGAVIESLFFLKILKAYPIHWILLMVFHVSFFLLLVGHIELIGYVNFFQIVQHDVFIGAGFVGILMLITLTFFLFRRFHSPVREGSDPANYYILILLILTVLFGSQLHLARRIFGYSTLGVQDYRLYLSSLITFHPILPEMFVEEGVGHSILLVLHVFFANILLMIFPSSRMMHTLLAIPLARLQRR
jgi:[DsrC]-trisulfide reductase subunit M